MSWISLCSFLNAVFSRSLQGRCTLLVIGFKSGWLSAHPCIRPSLPGRFAKVLAQKDQVLITDDALPFSPYLPLSLPGKPNVAVYLLDEPSSYAFPSLFFLQNRLNDFIRFLDSEQRIIASKVIKRFILHAKKTAFVIEHDFIMATYLADRVIVFEGQPARKATATPYVSFAYPVDLERVFSTSTFCVSC